MGDELAALETVVGVLLSKGVSIKPPGDVITIDVLNKGADDVLKLVRAASEKHEISITTHEPRVLLTRKKARRLKTMLTKRFGKKWKPACGIKGELGIVKDGFQRLGLDGLIIFAVGWLVFFIKQVLV